MFKLEFATANAAFTDGNGGEEIAVILRKIATQAADDYTSGIVMDSNGNRVGTWSYDQSRAATDESGD